MLKDLQGSLSKHHIVPPRDIDQLQTTKDRIRNTDVACNIVSHIFHSIDTCLQEDKSKVKLSGFTKSFIKTVLTGRVRSGIDDFVRNMNDREINILLDDIQNELNKRK